MTLVMSLITESWAIQVSDRRLVWLGPDSVVSRKDDERNKAVLWCNRLAFAYTGLAELGPKREATDQWLARELAEWWSESGGLEQGQDALIAAIIDRAGAAMRRPRIARGIPPDLKRHAFAGIGWARFDGIGEMVPYMVRIQNYLDGGGADQLKPDDFRYAVDRLPQVDNPIMVTWVGQELGPEKAMLEELKKGDPASKDYGPYAAEVLAGIVRAVAGRNALVGRGLLISALPKWAIHPGSTETFLLSSGPTWDELTFLHVPSDSEDPVMRGPLYVCEGRQMSNFQAWVPSEEEMQEMQEGAPPTPPN
jgi:hypothetical protein